MANMDQLGILWIYAQKGYLERLNQSKDGLYHFLIVVLPMMSPQVIIEQVLESLEIN